MKQQAKQIETALLVIDVQNGLFEKPIPIFRADKLLGNISNLINRAREVNTPVFFIQHSSPKILEKGSDDWQLHARLQPLEDEVIIHKLHPNAFEDTNLEEELKKRSVSRVVVTGLVTHGCVKATCLGAMEKGYQVVLVSDAHSSYSKDAQGMIEKWNRELSSKGAVVVNTTSVTFLTGIPDPGV